MKHYHERPGWSRRLTKYWWGSMVCFIRGHHWVQLFCTKDDTMHPYCPRCEEWRA